MVPPPPSKTLYPVSPLTRPTTSSYICTGLLKFHFNSNNGERTGVLTTYAVNQPPGVLIYKNAFDPPLGIRNPRTQQLMRIRGRAITASLAAIDNDQDDNGIWTVESASIRDPRPRSVHPELQIEVKVQGANGIVFRGVSYTAFLQVSSTP